MKLRANHQRSKLAILFVWIVLFIEIISIFSSYLQYDLLTTVKNGGRVTPEIAKSNDLRELIIGLVYIVLYLVSAVIFIRWFRRACFNLNLKVKTLTFTDGWAAGAWFVPILALYRPYQIMKELFEQTSKYLTKNGVDKNQENSFLPTINIWWTLWILNSVLGQISFRYSRNSSTVDEFINGTIISLISSVIAIPLAIYTVKLINEYSELETCLFNFNEESEQAVIQEVSNDNELQAKDDTLIN